MGESEASGAPTCPVCFDEMWIMGSPVRQRRELATGDFFFACGTHAICTQCDDRLRAADDRRCPVCRKPRWGLSTDEAEPAADRNAPTAEELFGGGGMAVAGGIPIAALPRRVRRSLPPMFFPAVGAIDLPPMVPLALERADGTARRGAQRAAHDLIATLAQRARQGADMDVDAAMDAADVDDIIRTRDELQALAQSAREQARQLEMEVAPGVQENAVLQAMIAELCGNESSAPQSLQRWRSLHSAARAHAEVARRSAALQ